MGGGAAAAAGAAAIAQAIKASGSIVKVEPEDFLRIIRRQQEPPLVVRAPGGLFGGSHQYLSSYKGLAFFTKSSEPLSLPTGCEVIQAQKIWVPG